MSKHEELHICRKSCSQTASNQFNVLYPPSREARTQVSYGLSHTRKNRVQPEPHWLIWKGVGVLLLTYAYTWIPSLVASMSLFN